RERAHGGGIEHRARLQPELERAGADGGDERGVADEQAEPRADSAVLVEARGAEIDAELERLRLPEYGPAHARTAGVAPAPPRATRMRQPHRLARRLQRQQIVGHRQTREHNQAHTRLAVERRREPGEIAALHKTRPALPRRADRGWVG